jgi:hypothetical protein
MFVDTVFAMTPLFANHSCLNRQYLMGLDNPIGSVRCEVYFLCFDTEGFFALEFFTHQSRKAFLYSHVFYILMRFALSSGFELSCHWV